MADDDGAANVLDVEELTLDDDRVDRIDENRYVIDAGEGEPAEFSVEAGRNSLSDVAARFAVEITAKTDRGIDHERFSSNDVRRVFEELLRWYATRLDPDACVEEVLALLLEASDIAATTESELEVHPTE